MGANQNLGRLTIVCDGKRFYSHHWEFTEDANLAEVISWCSKANPSWNCTDKKGHLHKWTSRGREYVCLSTKSQIKKERYCPDDGDESYIVETTIFICKKCGEEIELGYHEFEQKDYIPTVREIRGFFCLPLKSSRPICASFPTNVNLYFGKVEIKAFITSYLYSKDAAKFEFIGGKTAKVPIASSRH